MSDQQPIADANLSPAGASLFAPFTPEIWAMVSTDIEQDSEQVLVLTPDVTDESQADKPPRKGRRPRK